MQNKTPSVHFLKINYIKGDSLLKSAVVGLYT